MSSPYSHEGQHHDPNGAAAEFKPYLPRRSRYDNIENEPRASDPVSPGEAMRHLAKTAVATVEGDYQPRHSRYDDIDEGAPAEDTIAPRGNGGRLYGSAVTEGTDAGVGGVYGSHYDSIDAVGTAAVPSGAASKPVRARASVPRPAESMPVSPAAPEVIRLEDITTFEQAAQARRDFKADTIFALINGEASREKGSVPGYFDIKQWADKVRAPHAEVTLALSSPRIARLHARTAAMIVRNQSVHIDANVHDRTARSAIIAARHEQSMRLRGDTGGRLEQAIHAWDADRSTVRGVSEAMKYPGMRLHTTAGSFDLMERFGKMPIKGIRPLISYQEDPGGLFIHWMTRKSAEHAVKTGGTLKPTHRIYLSPSPDQTPEVFEEIMTTLDIHGYNVAGKMLDRSAEAISNRVEAKEGKEVKVRSDGIVLGLQAHEADAVLAHILQLQKRRPELFQDRPTPKMALRIRDGVAVGAEPKVARESLTSHRADILGQTVDNVRNQLGLAPGEYLKMDPSQLRKARSAFLTTWRRTAIRNGIKPDNMSFNL